MSAQHPYVSHTHDESSSSSVVRSRYTKLYGPGEKYSWEDYGGWKFLPLNLIWFLIFTDFIIYWVHRLLHHPILYVTV